MKGISLRNFQIQTAKISYLSDIVLYSPRGGNTREVLEVAERIAQAQRMVRIKHSTDPNGVPLYNTFVVSGMFLVLPLFFFVL